MSTTVILIRHVESLGYAVSIFRANGTSELHATPLAGGPAHVARCNDGDGEEELYRAAVLLADACGVDLEDG